MQLMNTFMRHSLIQSYNKKNGIFLVRPYIKNLRSAAQVISSGK